MDIDLTDGAPVRVVIVEPRRLFRDVLRIACERDSRIEVVGLAGGPDEAVRVCARNHGAVVVVDVATDPGGLRLVAALAAMMPDGRILALVSDEPGTAAEVLDVGARGTLSMGDSLDNLAPAILAVASGEVAVSGAPLTRLVRALVAVPEARDPRSAFLTGRERDVLRLLAAGRSTTLLAEELGISVHTARTHIQSVLAKLNVHSRLEAAAYAVAHDLS